MLDKIDRKLLALLQQDCTLSLQALAEAVNLTTTPCWKRLKRLEDDGILIGKVALLDPLLEATETAGGRRYPYRQSRPAGSGKNRPRPDRLCADKNATSQQRMVLPLCHGGYRNARSAGVLAHGW
ncbi:Lrp/AsnC family transcriptional regulator [Escherichia coli]|nr:Lrp/AsnC family transcriptional regulator [Escherichia coli]